MRDVEIYINGQAIMVEDAGIEIDVYDDSGVSAFGSAHITVAEMIRRVQLHDELVAALRNLLNGTGDGTSAVRMAGRAVLAKAKGTP